MQCGVTKSRIHVRRTSCGKMLKSREFGTYSDVEDKCIEIEFRGYIYLWPEIHVRVEHSVCLLAWGLLLFHRT